MGDDRPVIHWTRGMVDRFAIVIADAELSGRDTFTFDGHTFVLAYARYLLQYLQEQFK